MHKTITPKILPASETHFVENSMVVLEIRPLDTNPLFYQVIFKTSARIYQLSKNLDKGYLSLLESSLASGNPVTIIRKSEQSDTILSVR